MNRRTIHLPWAVKGDNGHVGVVALASAYEWRHVLFHPAGYVKFRVVAEVDGSTWLEWLHQNWLEARPARGPLYRRDDLRPRPPLATNLLAKVSMLPDDVVRLLALRLARMNLERAEFLERATAPSDVDGSQSPMLPGQQARVHRATCHVAALEIEDSTQRAVALHIADNFAGTVAELLDITKAINDPR